MEERCTPVISLSVGTNKSVISEDANMPILQPREYSSKILCNIPENEEAREKTIQSLVREYPPLESIPANQ